MNQRSMSDRVEELLGDANLNRDDIRYFHDRVAAAQRELSNKVARGTTLLASLAVLFLLLAKQDLSEVEVFGVKLSEFDLILLLIPVTQGLIYIRIAALDSAASVQGRALKALSEQYYPSLRSSELDELIEAGPWAVSGGISADFYQERGRWVADFVTFLESMVVLFGLPILFTGWAYYELFMSPDISTTGTIISLSATVILLALGLIHHFLN